MGGPKTAGMGPAVERNWIADPNSGRVKAQLQEFFKNLTLLWGPHTVRGNWLLCLGVIAQPVAVSLCLHSSHLLHSFLPEAFVCGCSLGIIMYNTGTMTLNFRLRRLRRLECNRIWLQLTEQAVGNWPQC